MEKCNSACRLGHNTDPLLIIFPVLSEQYTKCSKVCLNTCTMDELYKKIVWKRKCIDSLRITIVNFQSYK